MALIDRVSDRLRLSAGSKPIAADVATHFTEHFSGTPFKGLLVAPSRTAALRFKLCLDKLGVVSNEAVISLDDQDAPEFRQGLMQKFGSEARYESDVVKRFKDTDHPKLLIVVDKLLSGFDAPTQLGAVPHAPNARSFALAGDRTD